MIDNEICREISAWVDSHEKELIEDISRLVAVKSTTSQAKPLMPFGEGPAAALAEAEKLIERHGMKATNYDNYVVCADLNDRERAMDILAHLDVVAEGEGWSSDPYRAVVKDGCLYGRGTDDDKGPAAAALYAMRCIKELGLPMKKNVRLILGTDEESGSRDIAYYYSKERPAENTFSPDASFPVYNVEKGMYACEFSRRWDKQEASPGVSFFSGGFRTNVLPSDAQATVTGLSAAEVTGLTAAAAEALGTELICEDTPEGTKILVKGTSAHASTPEKGNNGITALIELLCLLPLEDCESTRALRALKKLFPHGDGEGRALGIAMKDDISGALSLAFSILNMDDEGIKGSFDSRTPVCADEENCRKVAEAVLEGAGFTVKGSMRPPHHTPADTPFVKKLIEAYELYTGRKGECLSMGGGTYVHGIEGAVAFGASMPGFESHLHGADERVNIKDLLTACKIFAYVIYLMCAQ